MFCRLSDTVGPFGVQGCFTPLRQSEVIFVERMGPNNTHLEHLVRGVVEHPNSDSRAEGVPDVRPGCGFRAVFHECRFVVYGLVVICDQMGVSVLEMGSRSLFDLTL